MEKRDLWISFLPHRSVYSLQNLGICGRAELCFMRGLFFSSFFFSFPINTCQGFKAKSLAKAWASAPAQAKDGSKQGTERGIVPTLRSGKSRSGKKMQV